MSTYFKRSFISAILVLLFTACKEEPINTNLIIFENGHYFNGDSMVAFKELTTNDTVVTISNKKTDARAKRIDMTGKYIIPGMTDAHVHLSGSPTIPYTMIEPAHNAHSSLRCGVTTVIDLFYAEHDCARLRKTTQSWPGRYASVILSGPILTAPHGHGTEYGVATRTMQNVEEAEKITNEVIDNGMDVIKVVYQAYSGEYTITKKMLEAIVTTAHKRKIKVFAHIDVAKEAMDCIDVGVDILAHVAGDTFTDEHLRRIKESGILTIPTISVIKSYYIGHDIAFSSDSLLWQTAHPGYLKKFNRDRPISAPYYNVSFASNYRFNLSLLIKHKLPIVAGTDAGNYAVFYGYSLHDEIYQYVLAGMTPAEALNSATRNFLVLFPGKKTGIIEPGFDADLVILDKDPLRDIRNTKSIHSVYHRGILVNKDIKW